MRAYSMNQILHFDQTGCVENFFTGLRRSLQPSQNLGDVNTKRAMCLRQYTFLFGLCTLCFFVQLQTRYDEKAEGIKRRRYRRISV